VAYEAPRRAEMSMDELFDEYTAPFFGRSTAPAPYVLYIPPPLHQPPSDPLTLSPKNLTAPPTPLPATPPPQLNFTPYCPRSYDDPKVSSVLLLVKLQAQLGPAGQLDQRIDRKAPLRRVPGFTREWVEARGGRMVGDALMHNGAKFALAQLPWPPGSAGASPGDAVAMAVTAACAGNASTSVVHPTNLHPTDPLLRSAWFMPSSGQY
jgi:hypothetical protein